MGGNLSLQVYQTASPIRCSDGNEGLYSPPPVRMLPSTSPPPIRACRLAGIRGYVGESFPPVRDPATITLIYASRREL